MSTYISQLANWMVGKDPMSPSQLYDAGCPRPGYGRVMDIVKITDSVRTMCTRPNVEIKVISNGLEITSYLLNLKGRRSSLRRPQYQVLAVGDLTPAPRQGATKQQPKEADWSKVWRCLQK